MFRRKYDLQSAKIIFEENGCQLLAKQYQNTSTPMEYRCSCGSISKVALADFNRGVRCRKCGNKQAGQTRQNQLIDIQKIEAYYKEKGCQLISEYKDGRTSLEYICKCGHKGRKTWFHFQRNYRCGCCGKVRRQKYSLDEVKEIFAQVGCELLDTNYQNNLIPLKYRCSCGRESAICLNNFKRGMRCKHCGLQKMTGPNNHRWIPDRNQKRLNRQFSAKCGKMLRSSLKAIMKKKTDHTKDLLGYGPEELKTHITTHPNWQNVKDDIWHLDHIFPIAAFLEHQIFDLKLINSLDNLQPLSQTENNRKWAKYNKSKFKKWLKTKGVEV